MTESKTCPWGGLPCDCTAFPYLRHGLIPIKCEQLMPDEILGLRKVSDAGKSRHQAYLAELEANRKRARQEALR